MDDSGAGEIHVSDGFIGVNSLDRRIRWVERHPPEIWQFAGGQPTATPAPVRHHRIYKAGDDGRVNHVGQKLRPLRHRARNDRRRRRRENKLEKPRGEISIAAVELVSINT